MHYHVRETQNSNVGNIFFYPLICYIATLNFVDFQGVLHHVGVSMYMCAYIHNIMCIHVCMCMGCAGATKKINIISQNTMMTATETEEKSSHGSPIHV